MGEWENWPQMYYELSEREEKLSLLERRLASKETDEKDALRKKFWTLRYEKRENMPQGVDYFIRSWMELYFISHKPGAWGVKKRQEKDLKQVKQDMGFSLANDYVFGSEVLYQELCNGIKLYIELCKKDSKYNSQLLGLMKMKPEALVRKIGNEIWKISEVVPKIFDQEKEFEVFKKACKDSFWNEYPKYKEDTEIKLER